MLRFLHAADFHLDSAFRALPPGQAARRRREGRELAARLADYTARNPVDLVLLSGDLFDGADSYRETAEELSAALGRMGAPVFIAPGNHDFYAPGSPYAAGGWPENVHIFTQSAVERVALPELHCSVYGAAFTAPERTDSPLSGFSAAEDGQTIRLMVLHGDAGAAESRYCPVSKAEIAGSGLTYLALGHVHAASGPQRAGRTVWAYPGCPEGRGFDELGDKGFYLGMVDGAGGVDLEFVPFARRRYEILSVDVSAGEALRAVEAALPSGTAEDLYRILLTGETDERGVDPAELEAALADRFYALEVRDGTRVRQDVWARAEEDSLRGEFLRRLRRRFEQAESEAERRTVTLAVRFGLAALDHRDIL